jgi:hypothetical protein
MLRSFLVAGVAISALFAWTDGALATYPGTNGKIYFSALGSSGRFDVYSVNADGTGLDNITDVVTEPPGDPNDALLGGISGDGSRIVFQAGSPPSVWAINSDGTGPVDLTPDNSYNQSPDISADGTKIVWNDLGTNTFSREIRIMNADGSGKQLLLDDVSLEALYPVFTPDGLTIVLTDAHGASKDIVKASAIPTTPASSTVTRLTNDATTDDEFPEVSPDGQSVVFDRDPTGPTFGPYDLFRVGINGGAASPLVTAPDIFSNVSLSPDGTKMVYATDPTSFIIANADGTNPVPVSLPADVNGASPFSWATAPPAVKDTTAPETTIDKRPKRKSSKRKATFRFSSNEAGATFQCKLDKKPFAPCISPKTYKKLKPRKHKFSVFATDAAGNADASGIGVTFKVNDIKG